MWCINMKYIDIVQKNLDSPASQQKIKQANIKRILDIIRYRDSVSRAAIAKETSLTPTTVSMLVDELIKLHYVVQLGEGESVTGRKPILLSIDSNGLQIPVISLRSTGIQFVLYDFCLKVQELYFLEYPLELQPVAIKGDGRVDYRHIDGSVYVDMIEDILRKKTKKLQWDLVSVVCISTCGTIDWVEGSFSSSVLQVKTDADFINKLQKRLQVSLLVGNESACCAYSEKRSSTSDVDDLLYINACEGVGAGIIADGKMYSGAAGLAGEMGHISIDINGKRCFCGNRGCLERYINYKTVLEQVVETIKSGEESIITELCGGDYSTLNYQMLAQAYDLGDSVVSHVLNKVAKYLVFGISNMICAINSNNVVLGGGIEDLGPRFLSTVCNDLKLYGYNKGLKKVRVNYATKQDYCACLGIAKYFLDYYLVVPI